LPAKKLTAERLGDAIRTALEDHTTRGRAIELSERIAREVGTERASEEIEASLTPSDPRFRAQQEEAL